MVPPEDGGRGGVLRPCPAVGRPAHPADLRPADCSVCGSMVVGMTASSPVRPDLAAAYGCSAVLALGIHAVSIAGLG